MHGGAEDDSGVVEFVARFRGPRGEQSLHETSPCKPPAVNAGSVVTPSAASDGA